MFELRTEKTVRCTSFARTYVCHWKAKFFQRSASCSELIFHIIRRCFWQSILLKWYEAGKMWLQCAYADNHTQAMVCDPIDLTQDHLSSSTKRLTGEVVYVVRYIWYNGTCGQRSAKDDVSWALTKCQASFTPRCWCQQPRSVFQQNVAPIFWDPLRKVQASYSSPSYLRSILSKYVNFEWSGSSQTSWQCPEKYGWSTIVIL